MHTRYYLDTCIWRDYFEERSDSLRPIGEWAFLFIKQAVARNDLIIYSDLVEEELAAAYSKELIKKLLSIVPGNLLIKAEISEEQVKEALQLSKTFMVPKKDALHSVIARDSRALLISRDKHFSHLTTVVCFRKPEEIL